MLAVLRKQTGAVRSMGLRAMSSDRIEPQQAASLMQIGTRTIFDSDHGELSPDLQHLSPRVVVEGRTGE